MNNQRQKFIILNKTEFEGRFRNGSHRVGEFKASFNQLKKMLGTKYTRGGDKTNVTWEVLLDDLKTYFDIYDYKYYDKESPVRNPDKVIAWSIGGHEAMSGLKAELLLTQLKEEISKG